MSYAIVDYCACNNQVYGYSFTHLEDIEALCAHSFEFTRTQVFGLTYADCEPKAE